MNRLERFINADDYCLSDNVNQAIIDLAEKMLITSTTVMVNNKTLTAQVELPKLKNIGIGLHLNLTHGTPVSPVDKVKSLVGTNGSFYSTPVLWLRFLLGLTKKQHIAYEIGAQYALLSGLITPTHVDSHKHIHCFPFLGEYILECLYNLGIKSIRNPTPLFANNRGYTLLKIFCKRKKWQKKVRLFNTPEGIVSLDCINSFDSIPEFNTRAVEFVVHPALENEHSYLNKKLVYNLLLNQYNEKF